MRFVLAIVCFALAIVAMGLGIAERSVLAGPNHVTVSSTSQSSAPVTVISGTALNAYQHTQSVQLRGSSQTFAAYGRTADVMAWIGDAEYTRVSFDAKTGKLVSRNHAGTDSTVPSPNGSDLWLGQYTGDAARNLDLKLPSTMSIIAVSNGVSAAPSTVRITWPLDNDVPWSGPVIVIGAILLLVGLLLLLWAITHLRRMRGPRRTQPRMPKLPRQPRYKPSRKAITARAGKGRRAINSFVALAPFVAVLMLAGCTSTPTPVLTPTATPTSAAIAATAATAVTPPQLQQIVSRISATVSRADTNKDATLLETRMEGPALSDRLANYTIRAKEPKEPAAIAIPSGSIRVALPQASNTWPRAVFTVLRNPATPKIAPVALMLVQDDPRSNYKVQYAMSLQPGIKLPEVAPATVGSARIDPNTGLLKVRPSTLATAYGSILTQDAKSPSYQLFQANDDTLRTQVGITEKQHQQKILPATASLAYSERQGAGQTIALATNNSGAIAAVDLNEVETVRPVKAGASVSSTGGVKALSGKSSSTKGIVATYGDQLLFYVPPANKSGKIVLLGYTTGLVSAEEYKK